jgi:predicted cupin superfamily sugar epimerase
MTPAEIITSLGMRPHPEGGWYVETFRDAPHGGRGHSTAIYFLLERDKVSAWHRVKDAAELWHFYAGAALLLSMCADGGKVSEHRLGPGILAGERPQLLVPAGWWQTARSTGDWTLVGCTVAPGFDFGQFEMAEPGWAPG